MRVAMIDLTGQAGRWSEEALQLWRSALAQETAVATAVAAPAPMLGDPALRAAIGKMLAIPTEEVVVTAGARAAALALARIRPSFYVEAPTFKAIPMLIQKSGTRVLLGPWSSIREVVTCGRGADREVALWVTSPARNPDGRSLSKDMVRVLEDFAAEGGIVVQNETYRWYQPGADRVRGATIVGSLSKLAGAGARLGWIARPSSGPGWDTISFGAGPPGMWQRTWARFIEQDGISYLMRSYVEPAAAACRAFWAVIVDCFDASVPSPDGPSVLLPFDSSEIELKVFRELQLAGVIVTRGAAFQSPIPSLRFCFSGVSVAEAVQAAEIVVNSVKVSGVTKIAVLAE